MSKLHELLAVSGDLEGTAKKLIEEATVTFSTKADRFVGQTAVMEMFDANRTVENVTQSKALDETVLDKLDHVARAVSKWFNSFASVEASNQTATADLIVDGVTLAEKVPSTALLGLESRLKQLRPMYEAIPTLQPGVDWVPAPDEGKGVYKTREPKVRQRTEKQPMSKILVEATPHHPAQIEKWTQDVAVGKYTDTFVSGMLTPAEKSALLDRLDGLIRAVKKARQRANSAETVHLQIGEALVAHIHGA